ncbi:hypothetical protein E3N88_04986 [Mikania micrantha]|uniref:Uncharacterized protein n=1 Tax=Mikania micrantha TaxID=192012 RepID=A0A5N6PY46_9ASTR|nr:hypothetical protein E3N88_04986 [Mikania micrantha]
MSNKRNTPFSAPKPPPLDEPIASSNQAIRLQPPQNQQLIPPPVENPPALLLPRQNQPARLLPPQNPPALPSPPQNPPTAEYPVENVEQPEDEYVPNDPWTVGDDVDEETLNRWRNHDPWEDERNTDSDVSIFND